MSRRVITAADVQTAAADGRRAVDVGDDDLVTALARDEAARLGLLLQAPRAATGPPATGVATAVHVPGQGVVMAPFAFDVGRPDMDVRTTDVVTAADGSPMSAGFMTLRRGSFPWSLSYDEIEYVIEGELHIGTPQGTLVGRPGDVIYLPKDTDITFGTPSWARFLYVTHPADWAGPAAPGADGDDRQPTGATAADVDGGRQAASWDRPGAFPVAPVAGAVCTTCAGPVTRKPDHLTQIDAGHFGPKTHPRIRLRGQIDGVQSLALLVAAQARTGGRADLAHHLGTLAAYCRELMSAEYHHRAAAPVSLAGVDERALHAATHDPDGQLGIPHVVPGPDDGPLLHWLGWLRSAVREAELTALDAFPPETASAERASLSHGLNRLSSAVYYLQLLHQRPEVTVR